MHLKKYILILIVAFAGVFPARGQVYPVQDPAFYACLKKNLPSTVDDQGNIILSEAAKINGSINCGNENISNVDGIQYFVNATAIYLFVNNLTSLPDLSSMQSLEVLHVSDNRLTSLPDLSQLPNLKKLLVYNNELTSLPPLSANTLLEDLYAYNNRLTDLPPLSALVNLKSLEVGANQLDSIRDLRYLTNLQQLQCWGNKLTNLEGLSSLTGLVYLNCAVNKIQSLPDLSALTGLTEIVADNNELSQLPSFHGLTAITKISVLDNQLSFEDFLPLASHSSFSSFQLTPQKPFELTGAGRIDENERLVLSVGGFNHTADNLYKWFRNDTLLAVTPVNIYEKGNVQIADEGRYTCVIENSNPALSGIQLTTNAQLVSVIPCIDISRIRIMNKRFDCAKGGEFEIDLSSVNPGSGVLSFTLEGIKSGVAIENASGKFPGLLEDAYALTVTNGSTCSKTLSNIIVFDNSSCRELIITPDSDGMNDYYYFADSGFAEIYHSNGAFIRKVQLPFQWDGSDANGKITPGYYFVNINKGEKMLNFTVFY